MEVGIVLEVVELLLSSMGKMRARRKAKVKLLSELISFIDSYIPI